MKNRTKKSMGKAPKATRKPSPLRIDPTRTGGLRKQLMAAVRKRFATLRFAVHKLIVDEDVFGLKPTNHDPFTADDARQPEKLANHPLPFTNVSLPTSNTRWRFNSNPEKVKAFEAWLRQQFQTSILGKSNEELWQRFVEEGFRRGAGRSFDDVKKREKSLALDKDSLDFYRGTKDQFLRSAFARPVAVEKVQLLAGRVLTDLKGVTEQTATVMSRTLTDGLVRGISPRELARDLVEDVEGIGLQRALTIARTEIIRAHSEGQLTALEELGVEEVGVTVEWVTAGDEKVCSLCEPLEGVTFTLEEARGTIPRHPNCRCAFVPANVGEDKEDQKSSKKEIDGAVEQSQEGDDGWEPGTEVAGDRPKGVVNVDHELVEFSRSNYYRSRGEKL